MNHDLFHDHSFLATTTITFIPKIREINGIDYLYPPSREQITNWRFS